MDRTWYNRLLGRPRDEPVGVSFLWEYVRAVRILSGICHRGWNRIYAQARMRRATEEFRTSILASPDVREFLQVCVLL